MFLLKDNSGTYRKEVKSTMQKMLKLLNYNIGGEFTLVGIRGGWIASGTSNSKPTINTNVIDQVHPRCSVSIIPNESSEAIMRTFLAGTVPHIKYATESMENEGQGANRLEFGLHHYEVGIHRAGTPTGHQALVMCQKSPIRRTKNDAKYDNMDPVSFENPKDNIHAGWNKDENHGFYASAGCQVVSGYPDCRKQKGSGQWMDFWRIVSKVSDTQKNWKYILLPSSVVSRMFDLIQNGTKYVPPFIYGCEHEDIVLLKEKLGKYYNKKINETKVYDWDLMQLVLKFQTEVFGLKEADAIIGPKTLAKVTEIIK